MKKWLEKFSFEAKANAALILISFVFPALITFLFSGIMTKDGLSYWENYRRVYKLAYGLWGAPLTIGGVLAILLRNLSIDYACYFGCAFYFGTMWGGPWLYEAVTGGAYGRYLVAFVIVALICYIVYLKGKLKK